MKTKTKKTEPHTFSFKKDCERCHEVKKHIAEKRYVGSKAYSLRCCSCWKFYNKRYTLEELNFWRFKKDEKGN